jgi:hypothetical protein
MDNMRDAMPGDRVPDRLRLRDVALLEDDGLELFELGDQVEPTAVDAQVECDDRCALAGERDDCPGAEAAQRAGDEPALRRLRRQ